MQTGRRKVHTPRACSDEFGKLGLGEFGKLGLGVCLLILLFFPLVVFVALLILFCAPDAPTSAWKDRHLNQTAFAAVGLTEDPTSPSPTGQVVDVNKYGMEDASQPGKLANHDLKDRDLEKHEFKTDGRSSAIYDQADVKFAEATLVKNPTIKDVLNVALTLPVLMQCACYF